MISISDIHKKLGLNAENGLFVRNKDVYGIDIRLQDLYNGDFSAYKSNYKVEYNLKKLLPHSFFLFNNEPLLLFYDHSDNLPDNLSEKIWNFNKSALVFVNKPNELVIYNGFEFDKKSNFLKILDSIKKTTELNRLEEYSYWKIVSAELWNNRDEDFRKNTRVDYKLLENIKATRDNLINPKSENPLTEKHANRIIGRLIFVRYLIDRKVNLDYKGEGKDLLSKEKLPELILDKIKLFHFFNYLLSKFNGRLLPLNGEFESINHYHLKELSELFKGSDTRSKQGSLFNLFDFDFIPIELISHIYETFLGEKQDVDKAFYTPPFLVDYVLEQTVKPFVAKLNNPGNISCKTVDFTCGSGIFLCETLRTLINRYIELSKPDKSSDAFKEKIKNLLASNIFGNDVNREAIEIAKFSLFITLLDYFEDPKDIEDFEFPDISGNFFEKDVFGNELDELFGPGKKMEPDFILGNPPWGKLEKKSRYIAYCKVREQKENRIKKELREKEDNPKEEFQPVEIDISNKEFAQAFLLRLSDFSTEKTVCQIIVTSKILYNLQAVKFRNYFLNNYLVNEVLEISSVRHQIFKGAVGPAAIIKYKYAFGQDTKENKIDYVSLKPNPYFAIFKTILIEKYDYKEVIQNELIKNDWLWKVLVYGHILDYRFIGRLRDKNKFPITLGGLIEDKDNRDRPLFASVGVKVNKKDKISDAKHLKGLYFIQTDTTKTKKHSDLQRFYIEFKNNSIWEKDTAAEIRIIKAPLLLIKIGFSSDFKLVASSSEIDCVFTNSIYAIRAKSPNTQFLKNLLGCINSELMSFYMIMCGSSIGVEREQLINKELFPFPIVENENLAFQAKYLIKLKRLIEIHKRKPLKNNLQITQYEKQFEEKEVEMNELVFDLYNLSDTEKDLIAYAQEITIPVLQAKNKKYKEVYEDVRLYKPYKAIEKIELENYINIYKEHFEKFHSGGANGHFNVRVFQSKNIIAIEFYIDKLKHKNEWINEPDTTKTMEKLASLGFQKISNDLFIQKDTKTLNRDSFSVVKLNQYKYWHKAIARLDVIELTEAMIKTQIQPKNGKNQ